MVGKPQAPEALKVGSKVGTEELGQFNTPGMQKFSMDMVPL